jgi:RNA polymerase sigma factor (sigma-70 family)
MKNDAITFWHNQAGRHPLLTPAEEINLGGMVRAWRDHPAGPDLAPDAIRRRGLRARERIINGNLRLVINAANKQRRGLGAHVTDADLPDILQAGALGLARAAEGFDPTRGYKFSTYAYWWIRQGINRWRDSSSYAIRPPSHLADVKRKVYRMQQQLTTELDRQPTQLELATALEMKPEDLARLLVMNAPVGSLDAQVGGPESSPLIDLLAAPEPEESRVGDLLAAVDRLPDDQRGLICRYYGLDGHDQLALKPLAKAEGITFCKLKQRLRAAELRLRLMMQDPEIMPAATGLAQQLTITTI